ncbi:MAG: hypothetical protein CVT96_07660 [Bacteroidetes bacterium HGW-Bacteroidetes-13]|nr:MAG: hypothetical protein CVT96_07660 [Bacteroidetes bacterium HGW-Bacteroidetes-13]
MATIKITVHPKDDSQIEAVKAFMKALKIKFEISKEKTVTLSGEQKKAIDQALASIETKGTIEHNTVMEETKKRFPHLFNR